MSKQEYQSSNDCDEISALAREWYANLLYSDKVAVDAKIARYKRFVKSRCPSAKVSNRMGIELIYKLSLLTGRREVGEEDL